MEFDVTAQDAPSERSEIICSSPTEATMLAALLQAGIAFQKHGAPPTGSQLSNMFTEIGATGCSTRVEIEIPVGANQLDSAVRSGNLLNLVR
jgi:hypothetical protein